MATTTTHGGRQRRDELSPHSPSPPSNHSLPRRGSRDSRRRSTSSRSPPPPPPHHRSNHPSPFTSSGDRRRKYPSPSPPVDRRSRPSPSPPPSDRGRRRSSGSPPPNRRRKFPSPPPSDLRRNRRSQSPPPDRRRKRASPSPSPSRRRGDRPFASRYKERNVSPPTNRSRDRPFTKSRDERRNSSRSPDKNHPLSMLEKESHNGEKNGVKEKNLEFQKQSEHDEIQETKSTQVGEDIKRVETMDDDHDYDRHSRHHRDDDDGERMGADGESQVDNIPDSILEMENAKKELEDKEKQKNQPNFGLSGKLAEETNRVRGVTLLFSEPPDAKKPSIKWRLYVFKDGQPLNEPLHIHRQSCYLFGRERKVADIPTDHPSCSKQHAVIQFRNIPKEDENFNMKNVVTPYLMDLGSTNGTHLNGERIEPQRYYELFEKDTVKFGNSSREYVLLHDQSTG